MHTTRVVIAVTFIIFNSALMAATPIQKDTVMTEALFSRTKPQCVGRYLIDVPESFNNKLKDMVFIDDFKIESKPQYRPPFEQRIQRREKELRATETSPGNTVENAPFIKQVIQLPNNTGVIFDRNISNEDDLSRMLEAYVYVDGITFAITTKILDLSAAKYAERKKTYLAAGFTETQTNEKPAKMTALQSLISRLSGRQDEEVPVGKGLCIPNGFVRDDGSPHREQLTFRYAGNDFTFGLETNNTTLGSSDTLFKRSDDINEALKLSHYKYTISKKELSPDGIPAQEWLFGGKRSMTDEMTGKNEKVAIYDFIFYANEETASPQRPWMNIRLNSEYNDTVYSEAQMISIWDKLVGSLRYRPGAF
ncbi:T6SS immunity protein Tli4 family protein [Scandinavium goeteborgense]|uniref:T6SS immunity protein Tli4 family protein n=1 Tax=Scandinavium goeteborgense TaxID=1851514 RepID=UPI0015719DB5|nr:T6SS immunity protein Tli4 family protein [Scandinavium goeteborgense]QKN81408.1 hypothetical protein A8O29_009015 [Scandinavium goeteborgense]